MRVTDLGIIIEKSGQVAAVKEQVLMSVIMRLPELQDLATEEVRATTTLEKHTQWSRRRGILNSMK